MVRTLRSLMVIISLFISLVVATAAPLAAQSDEVDIAEIGDVVLDADPDALLEGLEEPIADRDLPEGFADAEFQDPDDATAESGLVGGDSLEGAIGSVAYILTADEDVVGGLGTANIQYVLFDESEISDTMVDDFIEGAEGGLDSLPEGTEGSVESIELEGEDAALMTVSAEGVVVQYVAIPVGNVFVFGSVILSGETLDADDVVEFTEALTLSAITHLGEVAEDAA